MGKMGWKLMILLSVRIQGLLGMDPYGRPYYSGSEFHDPNLDLSAMYYDTGANSHYPSYSTSPSPSHQDKTQVYHEDNPDPPPMYYGLPDGTDAYFTLTNKFLPNHPESSTSQPGINDQSMQNYLHTLAPNQQVNSRYPSYISGPSSSQQDTNPTTYNDWSQIDPNSYWTQSLKSELQSPVGPSNLPQAVPNHATVDPSENPLLYYHQNAPVIAHPQQFNLPRPFHAKPLQQNNFLSSSDIQATKNLPQTSPTIHQFNSRWPKGAPFVTYEDINRNSQISPQYFFDYKLFDFEPTEIDQELIIEMFNYLLVNDETAFFKLPDADKNLNEKSGTKHSQKIFSYDTSRDGADSSFYSYYFALCKLGIEGKRGRAGLGDANYNNLIKSPIVTRFSDYSTYVVNASKSGEWNLEKLEMKPLGLESSTFEDIKKSFPFYLLYVDLINTILAVDDFDKAGQVLRRERVAAGESYWEAIKYIYRAEWENEQLMDKCREVLERMRNQIRRISNNPNTAVSFIWNAIEYWLLSSRGSLLVTRTNIMSPCAKGFVNSMVFDWIEHEKKRESHP